MTEFRCEQFVFERYPDRMTLWPEDNQAAARRAVERLLEQHPGKVVTAEESYCIDQTNYIWPEKPLPKAWTHALLYSVSIGEKRES